MFDNPIFFIILILVLLGISSLKKQKSLAYDQLEDTLTGPSKGYINRTIQRERDFSSANFILNLSIWAVRLWILYYIFEPFI